MSGSAVSPGSAASRQARMRDLARARFRAAADVPTAFFDANAQRIARACLELARAFHAGHRLLVFGTGAQVSDALHVSVEFVHPVIVGKRALPVLALTEDPPGWLRALGEAGDVALALHAGSAASGPDPVSTRPPAGGGELADPSRGAARAGLAAARALGMRTLALVGPEGEDWEADYVFAVPSADPFLVQEVHETLYHVLWELVHVFLDHPEMLR